MIEVKKICGYDMEQPSRHSESAGGYDLSTAATYDIFPHTQVLIPTGFAWKIPEGYVGLIRDRSGMASKRRLVVNAGVVDSDYRGEVFVLLSNESDDVRTIEYGDRIAQMLIVPCLQDDIVVVDNIDDTARGDGGFGSTGK